MDEKKSKRIQMLTLAFGIAFMPAIWAVLSHYIGVSTGAAALICAGLYVADGNNIIGVAVIAGVVYVGISVDALQKKLVKIIYH